MALDLNLLQRVALNLSLHQRVTLDLNLLQRVALDLNLLQRLALDLSLLQREALDLNLHQRVALDLSLLQRVSTNAFETVQMPKCPNVSVPCQLGFTRVCNSAQTTLTSIAICPPGLEEVREEYRETN